MCSFLWLHLIYAIVVLLFPILCNYYNLVFLIAHILAI